jgi:hypothetical protein
MCLKKQKNKKKGILPIFILTMLLLGSIPVMMPTAQAVVVSPGTYFTASGGLQNHTVEHNMSFNVINISTNYLEFNKTRFTITTINTVHIGLKKINTSTNTGAVNDVIIQFNATCLAGNVIFNLTGLKSSVRYNITRDDVFFTAKNTTATGFLVFNCSTWSTHEFKILLGRNSSSSSIALSIPTGFSPIVTICAILFGILAMVYICVLVIKAVRGDEEITLLTIKITMAEATGLIVGAAIILVIIILMFSSISV